MLCNEESRSDGVPYLIQQKRLLSAYSIDDDSSRTVRTSEDSFCDLSSRVSYNSYGSLTNTTFSVITTASLSFLATSKEERIAQWIVSDEPACRLLREGKLVEKANFTVIC